MKKLPCFLSIALLTLCSIPAAVAQPAIPAQPSDFKLSFDLLSDTGGASLNVYLRNLGSSLRKNWIPLATEAANQPTQQKTSKQEETVITFTIASDGNISAMQLEDPIPGSALDRAAWNVTKATTCPPPPAAVKSGTLKLRVHYTVN